MDHDVRFEWPIVRLAPTRTRLAGESRFHELVDQHSRSNKQLSLISPSNPTSTNVRLSSETLRCTLSRVSLPTTRVGTLRLECGIDLSLVFHAIESFQRLAALASYEFAKNIREKRKMRLTDYCRDYQVRINLPHSRCTLFGSHSSFLELYLL